MRVLHVVHGWPPREKGGTEMYAQWLVQEQSKRHTVAVHTRRCDPGESNGRELDSEFQGVPVREFVNNLYGLRPPVRFGFVYPEAEESVLRMAREFRPDLVHVHHLIGHSWRLLPRLRELGVPVLMQLQDFWSSCARINLFHDGSACSGPGWNRCRRCLSLAPEWPFMSGVLHALRPLWVRSCLSAATAFLTAWPETARGLSPVHVLPYGVPKPAQREERPPSAPGPLRCGYLGTLWEGKGVHILAEAFAEIPPEQATLHVWGRSLSSDYEDRLRGPNVTLHGPLQEADKAATLASLDVLLMPSLAAESFGLVAREALAAGVPVVASRQSALVLLEREGALLVEPGDISAWRMVIQELTCRERLREVRAGLRAPVSLSEHACAVEEVYRLYLV